MSYDIVVAGVGGQGIVYLGSVIAEAAALDDENVYAVGYRGHAKREGSVSVHVRLGKAYSPVINPGEASLLIGLEPLEALRNVHLLKDSGRAVVEKRRIVPVSCSLGEEVYPPDVLERIRENVNNVSFVSAFDESNPRMLNITLLGIVSNVPGFPLSKESLEKVLESRGEKFVETFRKGMIMGRDLF